MLRIIENGFYPVSLTPPLLEQQKYYNSVACMENKEKALKWIIKKLEEHSIAYQVVGGLAAIAHGSKRELADIDLYISYQSSKNFLDDIKPHIYWGPEHQKDEHWDITYLKIDYEGQKIEIGDSNNAKIFDTRTDAWVSQGIDYSTSERKTALGSSINVMPLSQLLNYKAALNREVDLIDIQQLT